jgi:hypothetical protein
MSEFREFANPLVADYDIKEGVRAETDDISLISQNIEPSNISPTEEEQSLDIDDLLKDIQTEDKSEELSLENNEVFEDIKKGISEETKDKDLVLESDDLSKETLHP